MSLRLCADIFSYLGLSEILGSVKKHNITAGMSVIAITLMTADM